MRLPCAEGRTRGRALTRATCAWRRIDDEYRAFFTPPYPARTTVVAGLARERMLVEVEAVAVLGAAEDAIAVTGAD